VLIDTYNHERFIEQAILSVLGQDFPPSEMEVIVVDDGSTDRTPAIVQKFVPQVRYLRKANGGQASAFNAGIPEVCGEVVAFLDGDDWWVPGKLSKVTAVLRAEPEVGIVGHGTTEVYPDGRQHTEVLSKTPRFHINTPEGALAFRVRKAFLGTRSTIRAKILTRILPVPEEIWIEADEYVFTLSALYGDVLILPEPLLLYRIHGGNFFSVGGFNEQSLRRKQRCLALLAESLSRQFAARGALPEVTRAVTEAIAVEADQLRLLVGDGYPWETVRTELAFYRILHEDAPLSHRVFKYLSLIPAFFLPPRLFYRARQQVAENGFYLRLRRALLPIPQPGHVVRTWKESA